MVPKTIRVSAPGNLMLMGEHAVLRGKPALVAAVNERLSVDVFPRDDELVRIESDLGFYCKPYYDLRIEAPFQFILSAAMQCLELADKPPAELSAEPLIVHQEGLSRCGSPGWRHLDIDPSLAVQ